MKHILQINELFGLDKPKIGDPIMSNIIEILKDENIQIEIEDEIGYRFKIDNKRYFCFYNDNAISNQYFVSVSQGDTITRYEFSKKYWKELKSIAKKQEEIEKNSNLNQDIEDTDPTRRIANKYNL